MMLPSEVRNMRLSVSEMAELTGMSVRAPLYDDQIGLLCPETAADSGCRWYKAADKRFQKNLDRFGEGTASFLSAAIGACCGT